MRDTRILLHSIRSVHNVGAIFRTADAIGATKIYLTGYTPAPLDRFGQPRQDFAKCALGSEKTMAWEQAADPIALIESLKRGGFNVVAVEQGAGSIDYKNVAPDARTGKALVVFGNETEGVPPEIIAAADKLAEIPMRGLKESLNVSVSAGIVLYRWFDR